MFETDAMPAPLAHVLGHVRALATDVDLTSPESRAAVLAGLQQVVSAAQATYFTALASFDAHADGATLHGARSTSAWLQGALHLAPGEASTHVRVARATRGVLADSCRDLHAGLVTAGHLAGIERSVRHLPSSVRADAAETLGALARQVDVGRLRTAGRQLQHVVDPDGALAESAQQFERRYLHLSPLLDGMVAVDGLLDAEGAEVVTAALAPALVPAGEHDGRSTAQRRADGFVDLARTALDAGSTTLSRQPVQLHVHVPWQQLLGIDRGPSLLGESPCEGVPLPAPASERLGCDAAVSRIVFGPSGVPLELGRSQRLFSPAQRRALAVRDAGCRFPGCNRPPRYTDAHHIVPWSKGGASDLGNAVLLCRFHHRLVHEGGWVIRAPSGSPTEGGAPLLFSGPEGQLLSSAARSP